MAIREGQEAHAASTSAADRELQAADRKIKQKLGLSTLTHAINFFFSQFNVEPDMA